MDTEGIADPELHRDEGGVIRCSGRRAIVLLTPSRSLGSHEWTSWGESSVNYSLR
jgi:hypothetical protein